MDLPHSVSRLYRGQIRSRHVRNIWPCFSYFSNIGPNLIANIRSNITQTTFLPGNIQDTIFLKPTNNNEIGRISNAHKASNARGIDNLSTNAVKRP